MHRVSLFIELVRTRPVAVFWAVALTQALLWTIIPTMFYAAPPGELAEFMAVAHETRFGNPYGPPLAYWLAEAAFRIAGMFGVYLLSQICVLIVLWSVFSLGRIVVGPRHAVLAVLLMAGIAAFSVPTAEFRPALLAAALWSLMLLHYWRAVGEGRRLYWLALGFEAGLLLLTTYSGFLLLGLLLAFALINKRSREHFTWPEPYIGGAIAMLVFYRHLLWIEQSGALGRLSFASFAGVFENARTWLWVVAFLAIGHAGLLVLIGLSRGFTLSPRKRAAEVERAPVDPEARTFIISFALLPTLAIGLAAFFTGRADNFLGPALIVLTAMAVIVVAPDRIRIVNQRLGQYAWALLLMLPPLIVALAILVLPWMLATDLRLAHPAGEMGRFFAESFERRTGRPLAIVTGDAHTASLVALNAPSRPSVDFLAAPEMSPWVTPQDIVRNGAVVVWPTTTTRGLPPPAIERRFPGLVAEVPRAFERRIQGRLQLMRIGWAVIRPSGVPAAAR
jgi:4-amino-4-deoxy-L-arabinose transferase-like glycosyltransferase